MSIFETDRETIANKRSEAADYEMRAARLRTEAAELERNLLLAFTAQHARTIDVAIDRAIRRARRPGGLLNRVA